MAHAPACDLNGRVLRVLCPVAARLRPPQKAAPWSLASSKPGL